MVVSHPGIMGQVAGSEASVAGVEDLLVFLTGSGSGELEEQMAVGGWIFLLSPGAALERTGAMVWLSDSAELTVNFTIFFDDFSRLINFSTG